MNINSNFKAVVEKLLEKGFKITYISKEMGYTTTAQIYKPMNGNANLTSLALENFVRAFDVRPDFLFTGKGSMFNEENEPNVGYVVYNPVDKVYLMESKNFSTKLKCAKIYGDDIYAKSEMYNFRSNYPENLFGKNLEIHKILIELL